MKKTILTLTILITLVLQSFAQSRGLKIADENSVASGATKLVVVGVSKYQNVQSLSYAHTDALAFYNFMTSNTGGKIEQANTKLLINDQATAANIFAALDWLREVAKEGETVIFYFAGHGDLENKTMMQNGFLLATDAPRAAYMVSGTVGIKYLQDYLSTYVLENKAKVILITDACRSGKLAGGMEGSSQTTAALQTQWENIIKILSSQPGELSYESNKWNNGAGVFTYFLIKGLSGFADRNNDHKVTVNELNLYLIDKVSAETDYAQNPSIFGNQNIVLIDVDTIAYNKLKGSDNCFKLDNRELSMRGFDEDFQQQMDTATFRIYQEFRSCLKKGILVESETGNECAWSLYQKLKDNKAIKKYLSTIRLSLLSALQTKYTASYNMIIKNKLPNETYPRKLVLKELEKALELIDTAHILYNHLKAASYLWNIPIESINPDTKFWLKNVDNAIQLEPDNAVSYFYKGWCLGFQEVARFDEAIINFKKAIEFAPTWYWPLQHMADAYLLKKEPVNSINAAKKYLQFEKENIYPYITLYDAYLDIEKYDNAQITLNHIDSFLTAKKDVELLKFIGMRLFVGKGLNFNYTERKRDIDNSLLFFERIETIDSTYIEAFYTLGLGYAEEKNVEKANYCFSKTLNFYLAQLKLKPDDYNILYNLAFTYSLLGRKSEALFHLELALKNGFKDFSHIEKDTDLDNIRNAKEFKDLIQKYSKK